MFWFWGIFIFIIGFLAVALLIGYALGEQIVGQEVARRNLRHGVPLLLLGFALTFALSLMGRYSWTGFYSLATILNASWLISWLMRKPGFGNVLLNLGWTAQSKLLLGVGIFQLVMAVLQTSVVIVQFSIGLPPYIMPGQQIAMVVFYWSIALFFLAIGASTPVFREKGISVMLSFIAWKLVTAYRWEASKPNVLTMQYKPKLAFMPGTVSLVIPAQHRDAVNHILQQRVINVTGSNSVP